jgi:hypothetical protein
MKKITSLFLVIIMIILLAPSQASSRPFWIKFKIGILAKWSITFDGGCDPGWGLCLALGPDPNPEPNFVGYDNDVDKFYIRISQNYPQAKDFSNDYYELKEDSPIDPKLISGMTNFKLKGQYVVLKKGNYKVQKDGGYYLIGFDYYQK